MQRNLCNFGEFLDAGGDKSVLGLCQPVQLHNIVYITGNIGHDDIV